MGHFALQCPGKLKNFLFLISSVWIKIVPEILLCGIIMDEKSVSLLYRYKLIMSSEKKYICKNIGCEKSWLCTMVSLDMRRVFDWMSNSGIKWYYNRYHYCRNWWFWILAKMKSHEIHSFLIYRRAPLSPCIHRWKQQSCFTFARF